MPIYAESCRLPDNSGPTSYPAPALAKRCCTAVKTGKFIEAAIAFPGVTDETVLKMRGFATGNIAETSIRNITKQFQLHCGPPVILQDRY